MARFIIIYKDLILQLSAEKAKGNVIHTVGPVARGHVGPTESNDLTSCYQNSLRLMKENDLSTVLAAANPSHTSPASRLFWTVCFCLVHVIYGFALPTE
ncbi:ADP-ribose glycohydrolase MACROD2, partial [Dissostichus eleginoides]